MCRTQNGCSTGPMSFLWVKLTYFQSQKMFSHGHTTKIEFWGKSWNSCIESGPSWALTGPGSGPSLSGPGGPRPDKKLFFLKCLKMISGGGKCVRNHSKPSKTSPEVIFERTSRRERPMAADLPNYNVKSIFALFCDLFGNNWTKQLPKLGNTEECIHTPG